MFLLIFLSVSGENIDSSYISTTNADLLVSYIPFMIFLCISMGCDVCSRNSFTDNTCLMLGLSLVHIFDYMDQWFSSKENNTGIS
jgi:hypothetical protein